MSIYKGNKKVIALYKGATPIKSIIKKGIFIFDSEGGGDSSSLMTLRTNSNDSFQVKINEVNYTLVPTNYEVKTDFATLGIKDFTNAYFMFRNCKTITTVESLPSTTNVTNMNSMFGNCTALTSVDTSSFDTSNVTNMYQMFYDCRNLSSLDLSSFDTTNVTTMGQMFYNCSGLTSLDLSSFDTTNVTSMGQMFYYCSGLTSLDLSSFDTTNVTSMGEMFYYCRNLSSLDLSSFDTSKVSNVQGMFNSCFSLTSLDLSSFDTSNVTNMSNVFYNCEKLTDLIWNNLGNGSGYKAISFSKCSNLGINTETYPNARQHLTDTFITNSFDRASNGYSTCTITLNATTKGLLTSDEIAQMTAKGYTIA